MKRTGQHPIEMSRKPLKPRAIILNVSVYADYAGIIEKISVWKSIVFQG